MDKILSARIDEAVLHQVGQLATQLNMTQKAVIEPAITLYSQHNDGLVKTPIYFVVGSVRRFAVPHMPTTLCLRQQP